MLLCGRVHRYALVLTLAGAVWAGSAGGAQEVGKTGSSSKALVGPIHLSKEGINVEMIVESLSEKAREAPGRSEPFRTVPAAAEDEFIRPDGIMEGEEVELRFKISDSATGNIMTGVGPAAWIDAQESLLSPSGKPRQNVGCEDKVKWFLQGSLALQPVVNLNTFFILALNENATISVIDPQLGFYISKLLTTIRLKSPGEDWVISQDGKKLFVTMPTVHQVAAASTLTWRVVENIDAGPHPTRIALQPDEKYVWVGNDGEGAQPSESGVTVVDADTLQVVARIPTGAGHHELAFSDDSRHAFVSNAASGTLSIIDVHKLQKIGDIPTAPGPVSLAFSRHAHALYIAHEDGRIIVIDGKRHNVVATLTTKPGARMIRFTPGEGRWGLIANHAQSVVHVLDSSVNRLVHEVEVEKGPDQIQFTPTFAYVRSTASEKTNIIQLSLFEQTEKIKAPSFPTGSIAPEKSPHLGPAHTTVPTPENTTVLIANPADKTIYYYMEGMLAPMGNFQNYGHTPRGILVADRSLKETAPGVYSTTFTAPPSGKYDVAFLMDSPLTHLCFEMQIQDNPALADQKKKPLRLEYLSYEKSVPTNQATVVRLRLSDPKTGRPKSDLKDVSIMATSVTGAWQSRAWATSLADGIYEAQITVPTPGYYYIFVACPSEDAKYNQLPRLLFEGVEGNAPDRRS